MLNSTNHKFLKKFFAAAFGGEKKGCFLKKCLKKGTFILFCKKKW